MFPKNGIYIIQGEVNHVVAALRRSNRWSGGQFQQDDDNDPLLNSFAVLKDSLQDATDFSELDTNIFLGPFLEVIRSEDTTGPITGVALSSVNKFLSYGLLDPTSESASSGIDNLADAVNHARFVGTDPSSDEVVLMKILQVLRTLLLSPVGVHMTNEAVCEIMQSCFRICFEMRLTELLRRSAEQTLIDMVQLLFLRLPQFKDDIRNSLSSPHIRKLFKRSGHSIAGRKSKKSRTRSKPRTDDVPHAPLPTEVKHSHSDSEMATSGADSTTSSKTKPMLEVNPTSSDDLDLSNRKKLQKFKPLSAEDAKGADNTELGGVDPDIMKSIDDISEACDVSSKCQTESETESVKESSSVKKGSKSEKGLENFVDHGVISLHYPEEDTASVDSICLDDTSNKETKPASEVENKEDYVNSQGIRFTPQENNKEGQNTLTPYGLPCVHELLRYLTSLINPGDRHNTNTMIHIGLSLITVALESGAPHLSHFPSLLQLVKNDLCRNLFTLLQCDIHLLFSLSMRVCFLLFEALRPNLKYQNERFFVKMMDILSVDNLNVPYEKREMALEYINQLFHIPGLVQELYVNFDCDLHCSNVLEDLCKILSKNAFRPGSLASVNHLSLEALLTITNEIESQCLSKRKKTNERTISCSSSEVTVDYESGSEETHDITHTALSTSGYAAGQRFLGMGLGGINEVKATANDNNKLANINEVTERVPTKEEIVNKKLRKKLLTQGIEEFNKKPKAGIEFMQEHNLLSTPYNPEELVAYLKENPRVDKKTVGEFIGARKNPESLKAFVSSFSMKNVRIDEALRDFLESFRLPGEAPVISLILEEFTSIYFEKNLTPYKNNDAAFTLAYAVIMLNVDQHNKNVKQQKSMSVDDFKRNLRKTNGDEDFPPELLEEIFENIRTNEIVMPSERVGKVKDAYEWKVLLQKCNSASAAYTQVSSSLYDEELFLVVWGPTVAALSYVYENANDKAHIQKTLAGFKKCAVISAHYNLSEVFDNLLISLCKFTKLLVTGETSDNLPILFGNNLKAQLSMRTVFTLTHKQGDILREGWQNLLVCLTQLLKGKLLPTELTEVEDFVEQSGKVSLIKEEVQPAQKQDTSGVFATFYSYMVANPDVQKGTALTVEDKQAQETAVNCIKECHPENIITESKFLRPESLQELIKALVIASKPEHSYESTDVPYDEDGAVFFLEFLIRVALQNRDRISLLWQALREHLSNIIIGAPKVSFLVERAVVGLLRLSIRLLRRDDISGQVLITLRILLMMHPKVLLSCSKQISYGLHELIRTNAPNLHYSRDWITVLTILQVVGAGASPPIVKPGVSLTLISGDSGGAHVHEEPQVDTETGETLSAEHMHRGEDEVQQHTPPLKANNSEQWLLINKNEDDGIPVNQYELKFKEKLNKHDCRVFIKTSSSVNFIVQEMAHVNEANIFQCIYAVLLFGEACRDGGMKYKLEDTVMHEIENEMQSQRQQAAKTKANSGKSSGKGKRAVSPGKRSTTDTPSPRDDDEQFNESTGNIYDAISLQLLDLMYALHTKASGILGSMSWSNYQDKQQAELKARWSSKESIDQLPSTFRGDVDEEMLLLWVKCWCPLLQGIARLCCDSRRDIRMSALTVLQRSMLAEDLQSLTATEWENCFNQVLFPMLASLLELSADVDPLGLEETRMRAATLLCKAFLQHLNTLITLSTFTALWMTILDFMDKYMHADNSELLYEAIPESLKNMLLVMSTAGIFEHCLQQEGSAQPHHLNTDSNLRRYSALWQVTWDRIDCFLPNLKSDLMATRSPVSLRASSPPEPDEPQTMTIHTEQDIHTPHQHPAPQEETAVAGEPATNQQTAGTAPVSAPASPTVLPQTFNSPPLATTPPSANAAQRAASPLLSNEITAGLNVQLFTPLPILSPPGSAHAIQRGDIPTPLAGNTPSPPGAHPVPVLLPAMPLLTTPASPEKSSIAEKCQGQETSSPQEKEENSGKSSVFDI